MGDEDPSGEIEHEGGGAEDESGVVERAWSTGFPLARVRRLMMVEGDAGNVGGESPILLSIATERFVEDLTTKAWERTSSRNKIVLKGVDVEAAIISSEVYDFLRFIIGK